jgi:hypothetical protein
MVERQENGPVTRVRMWRWRRSPLRRRSDLLEAWVLLAAWVLAVLGGVLAGFAAGTAADRSFDRQRSERHEVVATVVKDNRAGAGKDGAAVTRVGEDDTAWATVRWTGPQGEEHKGRTQVAPDTRAGARVTIWTDPHGALASEPLTPPEALLEASLLGAMATAFTGGTVWAFAYGIRGCLERRRMAQWDAEWQRVDTRWGRMTG